MYSLAGRSLPHFSFPDSSRDGLLSGRQTEELGGSEVSKEPSALPVDREKWSPAMEAKDLLGGDWDSLRNLEKQAAEQFGQVYDDAFRRGFRRGFDAAGGEQGTGDQVGAAL
jgi:hypothetical protein